MKLIISSELDKAGENIRENLLEKYPFEQLKNDYFYDTNKEILLVRIKSETIYTDFPEKIIQEEINEYGLGYIDSIFFASRHKSVAKIPTLTCHTPGNFGKAEYGGVDGQVSPSNPIFQKIVLNEILKLSKNIDISFEVSLEATHHGPLTGLPTTFIEIGSDKTYWGIKEAGEVIASAIYNSLSYDQNKTPFRVAAGIGGGHYCPKFTEIMINTDIAIGHVIAKYNTPVNESILSELLLKSTDIDLIILDWKGIKERSDLKDKLTNRDIPFVKASDIVKE
ncbi:MAG: D-tyrosyl-tRNA(Tyr) deacylase [Euryarchaeota archaeon ADurb.Bin023]|jgi:D-aminoacyl-tRNA deacylase|nr:MAG: D-tyrosyl-tRNA(Tyr) deacylase [Euryarchaeota archaeon ADurb.Bin023]HNV93873.1 D-aminoacyl-tRNA deacylase [Methanofastidiosum sp.]HOE92751.1 D-aminoacyl-tRNA deacylase [Methanofastidiosum sp.]HOR88212.1 D-aminoacyl-tRNA deacylase [Methanofastidiosum sp.]HOT84413.1 D-aminoacyl-tRNA deacylase [Methanofastidiosum sp.]